MASPPSSPLQHPVMLDDLLHNLQEVAASLPPDGWAAPPRFSLQRQASGYFSLHQVDIAHGFTPIQPLASATRRRSRSSPPVLETGEKKQAVEEERRKKRRGWISFSTLRKRFPFAKVPKRRSEHSFLHRLKNRMRCVSPLRKQKAEKNYTTETGPLLTEKQ